MTILERLRSTWLPTGRYPLPSKIEVSQAEYDEYIACLDAKPSPDYPVVWRGVPLHVVPNPRVAGDWKEM